MNVALKAANVLVVLYLIYERSALVALRRENATLRDIKPPPALPEGCMRMKSGKYEKLSMANSAGAKIGLQLETGCKSVTTIGGGGGREGSWALCLDQKPLTQRLANKTCVVYGFGIREDWSFEASVALMGCTVYAFDPSLTRKPGTILSPGVVFYPYGIAKEDGYMPSPTSQRTWEMRSVASIMKEFKHTHVDILKFDVEGSEWGLLQGLAAMGTRQLGQVVSELHFYNKQSQAQTDHTKWPERKELEAMRSAGWKLWRREDNELGYPGDFQTNRHLSNSPPFSFGGLAPANMTYSCCFDVGWVVAADQFLGDVKDPLYKWVEKRAAPTALGKLLGGR